MDTKNELSTPQVSKLAEHIIGSEIIKLAAEVNERIKLGEKVYNLTIGDFNPKIFPIPAELKQYIREAYEDDQTNYPAADGMAELRQAVSQLLVKRGNLNYTQDEIVITGGARPAIYAIFKAIVDPGDAVIFPVPSWNNNHYTYLNNARPILVETSAENNFMPRAVEIAPFLPEASLLALCSPLNPTGTVFSKEDLEGICDLVLAENRKRALSRVKPLYVMYDQIYWPLTHSEIEHYNPVTLRPEMRDYTLFVDGISKSLAATGVRVGWTMGPKFVINKIKSILTHVGAWAPRAEQMATAKYLNELSLYDAYLNHIKSEISSRLLGFYNGFQSLKAVGHKVDAIAPEAAIYLAVQFQLHGKKTVSGEVLETTQDITKYILDEAKVAIVPFYAFGSSADSSWYRLSVGTCRLEDVDEVIANLKAALEKLN
ncbi:aminotransferase class I/II-fold pyridoxal phosphate-dependent enzyme [Fluviicola sp.]|jgi:aspartate aminotransferase|uniref:pyridoxal phosphate-dependent aminotransferase n=1 Tax=Fluviicola sp. TaxID=1917219 RepID=UPI0028174551|nr:aminotransferase class I/II-fold pyridoxal phosphate-dependent enzyme [Fluviicola sp.]MDR0803407.1 aminotransferase class I/II-fold pyridoxal phosphate-dependent enzyme [Fluviicola sp.]